MYYKLYKLGGFPVNTLTMKTLILAVLVSVAGSIIAEETKPTPPSSDSGLLYRFHDPLFGFAIEVPAVPLLNAAWFLAKWGTLAGGAYGIWEPRSKVALPAQLVAGMGVGAMQGFSRVWNMRRGSSIVVNPNGDKQDLDANALRMGTGLFVAGVLLYEFYPHLLQYGYNKLPSSTEMYQRMKEKIAGNSIKKSENSTAETIDNNELAIENSIA